MTAAAYFDRDGSPVDWTTWLATRRNSLVAETRFGEDISLPVYRTVHAGADPLFDEFGRPLVFETVLSVPPATGVVARYATEAEALSGHRAYIAALTGETATETAVAA